MDSNISWVEVKNGDEILFADSIFPDAVIGISVQKDVKINFQDSVTVKVISNNDVKVNSYKLAKKKFIIIDLSGLNFNVYSSDTATAGI